MKREDRDSENLASEHAFVHSLLDPLPSNGLPTLQENARQVALTGLTNVMETVARCELPLEERGKVLRAYRQVWLELYSIEVNDPATPGRLIQIASKIKAAQDGLVIALFEEGMGLTGPVTDA